MIVPGSINPLLLTSAAAAGGFQVSRSLRFNSGDSAYLSRTPSVAGNRRTFTLSWWIKKSGLTTFQSLFNSNTSANDRTAINFDASIGSGAPGDYLTMFDVTSATYTYIFQTNALFRDASAWYHIVVAVDTTQATSTERVKLWVNNTLQTFSTYNAPSQNANLNWNSATTHYYGVYGGSPSTTSYGFNGYLANVQFIDGQALTPSSFTEVSATTGQLIPKAYSGTYGTNGFYLKFADNSTTAALGTDSSGNGNTWTTNNFSVTAGAGNDSLVDTPTSYGTDTGVGGSVRGNYCTLNPLKMGSFTLSNGNLDCVSTSSYALVLGTIGMSSGKWYFETTLNGSGAANSIGIATDAVTVTQYPGYDSLSWTYLADGRKINGGSRTSYGASFTTGDVIGIAFDADAGSLTFYKNGTSQGTAFTSLTSGPYFPCVGDDSSGSQAEQSLNFGQRAFAYTAPSGFKALCDTNLGAPVVAKPNTLMDVALYTGNGSTQSITGLAFSPDLVWIKARSYAYPTFAFDVVRGATNYLMTSSTGAEDTIANSLTSFNSDGFSVGASAYVNYTSNTFVGWCWDAGTSTVSNTQGSITSQVRANASAGFSVVTYTGPGSSNSTVGHGLGVAPELIITKNRDRSIYWIVYTKATGKDAFLRLNTTDASQASGSIWGAAAPTSTVFGGVGTDLSNGYVAGEKIVSYCFAPVVGYSSFGSYVGSGTSDGPFVYTGFRPRFVLAKRTDNTGDWFIWDAARVPYNQNASILWANSSNAETTSSSYGIDLLSNGFKLTGGSSNSNFGTLVYAAFAEAPFQYARAR